MNPEHLKRFIKDNNFRMNQITKTVIDEPTFSKWHIPVGKDLQNRTFALDYEKPHNSLVLGAIGSGKTFLVESMISKEWQSGYAEVILSDVKNEYWSLGWKPIQEKFRSKMMKGDVPRALPVWVYRPKYFQDEELPEHSNEFISMSFANMTKLEFNTVMKYKQANPKEQDDLDMIWKIKEKNGIDNMDDFIAHMEELHEDNVIGRAIVRRLRVLQEKNMFDDTYSAPDLIDRLNAGFIIIFNMQGYEDLGDEGSLESQAFISSMHERIAKALRNGELKRRVVFTIEEASVFLKKGSDGASAKSILQGTKINRARGALYRMIYQVMEDVPEQLKANLKHKFIPANVDEDTLAEVLQIDMIIRNKVYDKTKITRIKNSFVKYSWLVTDKDQIGDARWNIFISYPPLGYHVEGV